MSTNNNNKGRRTPTHTSTIDEGWKNAGGSKVSKTPKTTPAQTRSQKHAKSTSKPTSSKHDNVNDNSFSLLTDMEPDSTAPSKDYNHPSPPANN